ncbi:hypothetical protein F383_31790 [Gossypium arboreum]|uniref:Uncharacterized protein n=1 Tax=Gossypium arboreum TaxID=29729 RepID=A0A0B0MVH3_GOSAR|nr:hypothetical protein F383_31790 [Gossypium arboreum]
MRSHGRVSTRVRPRCNSLTLVTRSTTRPCVQPVCLSKWPHKLVCQAVSNL